MNKVGLSSVLFPWESRCRAVSRCRQKRGTRPRRTKLTLPQSSRRESCLDNLAASPEQTSRSSRWRGGASIWWWSPEQGWPSWRCCGCWTCAARPWCRPVCRISWRCRGDTNRKWWWLWRAGRTQLWWEKTCRYGDCSNLEHCLLCRNISWINKSWWRHLWIDRADKP